MTRRKGFTLVEIIAMAIIFVLVSGTLYKIFSGTWMNFFKTQTKLTNLRAATVLLEYLKHDIRLSVASAPYKLATDTNSFDLQFVTADLRGTRQTVNYKFSNNTIRREFGASSRVINSAKVSKFNLSLHQMGMQTCMRVQIEVDAEKDEVRRAGNSLSNKILLSAALFPRFLQGFSSKEEEYWYKAHP